MNIVIIGGGAAGMIAAISAAEEGAQVTLIEKNEKLGKKIYITGKGRCNITNAADEQEFFASIVSNSKFMFSSYGQFSNYDMISLLEQNGMPTKTERGNRVFPVSDKASDVTKTLEKIMRNLGVKIELHTEVKELLIEDGRCIGVIARKNGKRVDFVADRVIVATGGLSYPTTGSTGDGYKFAKDAGHDIAPTSPSLVSMKCTFADGTSVKELAGLSLKNVRATIEGASSEFGEMLFTHDGVSGPIIITLSALISGKCNPKDIILTLDLKPALDEKTLDARLLREFDEAKNKDIKNVMRKLLPESLVSPVLSFAHVNPDEKIHDITKEMREGIVHALKNFSLKTSSLGGYEEAIITKGGISVKQINPKTMESKLVSSLYFAGEVLDIDAFTGGFNLQLAWSTGYAAGKGATNE